MEQGTPIGKLRGLDFYVYLYQLDLSRKYLNIEGLNTIGLGYCGSDEDLSEGMKRIRDVGTWLKENIEDLRKKYGPAFPDQAQLESFHRFDLDLSLTIGYGLMRRDEAEDFVNCKLRKIQEA